MALGGFLAGQDLTAATLNAAFAAILSGASGSATVNTLQTTASTSYANLGTVGPAATVTSVGTRALIIYSAGLFNTVAANGSGATVEISGATTLAAADGNGLLGGDTAGTGFGEERCQFMFATITPGSNTFTMKYRVTAGTGSFQRRRIIVFAP